MRRLLRSLTDMWQAQGCLGQSVLLGALSTAVGIGAGVVSIRMLPPGPVPGVRLASVSSSVPESTPTTQELATHGTTSGPGETPTSMDETTPIPEASATHTGEAATSTSSAASSETLTDLPPTATPTQPPPSPLPTLSAAQATATSTAASPAPHVSATVPVPVVTALPALTGTPVPGGAPRIPAAVVWAIDGETIEVSVAGRVYRVRYLGIDAPDAGVEPIGRLATARNRQLVAGQYVFLEGNRVDSDQYQQLLRYVFIGDLLVNAELVRDGYARAVLEGESLKYAEELRQAELDAAASGRQFWSLGSQPTVLP